MNDRVNLKDPNVQYLATDEFMQTLLSGQGLSKDFLDLLYDNYDLMADPGIDRKDYKPGTTRTGHKVEKDFLKAHKDNRAEVSSISNRLASSNRNLLKTPRGQIPWQLIAMAIQRSTDTKQRVVLTDDEGLMELLQYHGIKTMESDTFKRKLEADKVIEQKPGLEPARMSDSAMFARKVEQQRMERQGIADIENPGVTSTDSSDENNQGDSARRQKLGGSSMDM
jgi:hypothetical protein